MKGLSIGRLSREDDLGTFDCGEPALNEYLARFALKNQFSHFAVTYVASVGEQIVGFLTLAASQISRAESEPLGARVPRYPLPTLTVARLAVDTRWHGRGVGTAMLRFALAEAVRMADEFGCVDPTDVLAAESDRGCARFHDMMRLCPSPHHSSGWAPVASTRRSAEFSSTLNESGS